MTQDTQNFRALYVDGVGFIDEYGSYINTMWEKGVIYFVRDYYQAEIERRADLDEPVRALVARLDALNSDIRQWEDGRKGAVV